MFSNFCVFYIYTLQVNENGLFSFNEPFSFSHPNQFPTDNIYSRIRNVVAPFWSDNDIRRNGTIRYVGINIRYPLNSTRDHENHLISEVLAHLRKTGTTKIEQEFQPRWMIVAQWDKVPPFSQEGVSSKVCLYNVIYRFYELVQYEARPECCFTALKLPDYFNLLMEKWS